MLLRLFSAVFLFTSIFFIPGSAQNPVPVFRHYTTEDGLPSSQIYQAMQDKDGYVWFATDRGVVKYNGYEFKTFTTQDGLTDNVVFRLFQDDNKRIWMISFSGSIFIYENKKISPYKYNFKIKDLLKGSFQLEIYVDQLDNVFVSSTSGEFMIDRQGRIIQKFKFNGKGVINKLLIDEQNEYLSPIAVGSVARLAPTDLFYVTKSGMDSIRMPSSQKGRIRAVRFKKNVLLFSVGASLYELSNKSTVPLAKLPGEIINLVQYNRQELWVCTMKGLYLFFKTESYTESCHYLEDKYISNITRDKEGGYWISTIDDGAYYLVNNAVKNYITNAKLKSALVLAPGKSRVYAGYFSGSLAAMNSNELSLIINDSSENFIDCIFCDTADNRLYFGNDKIRCLYNNTFIPLKTTSAQMVRIGFVKNKKGIFTGAFNSLVKIAGDSTHRECDVKIRMNCIYSNDKDELFLGCIDGAYNYDEKNKKIRLINKQLKDVRVDDIESLNGNLCFATQGKGLMIMMQDSTFKNIDESQGLCNNIIRKLWVSGTKIWCASYNGISEINFTDFANFKFNISNIRTNEGLISNEINDLTVLNDTVWVASKKGVSFFNAQTDFVNHAPPIVNFISFRVNHADTIVKNNYRFPHALNTISIGFEAPLFKSNGKQSYQYLLINNDDSIIGKTTNREIEFLSLTPGNYSLYVKGVNNSGVQSAQPATLHFTILDPWWQTWWFRFFVIIAVVASGLTFYKNRVKKLKEEFNIEKKQASLQLTAMRAQMNPHFIFNVMNSIRNYMQNNDMESAEKYLTSFAKLVRYTLDNSAVQEVSLEEELLALQNYAALEMQRVEYGFDFEVQCDESIDMEETMLPSLLLQPFVENAIKHGIERLNSKGKIRIEIIKTFDSVLISIEDNGMGRMDSSEWNIANRGKHNSHGSKLTFERIEAFNKAYNKNIKAQVIDLNNQSNHATGTRVEIVL